MLSNHFRPLLSLGTYPKWMPKKATAKPETKEPKAQPPRERVEFGARLKALRNAKDLTLEEVATKFEVKGRGTPWAWENGGGAPDAFMLRRLADFYGVSADYLLWGDRTPAEATVLKAFREGDATRRAWILLAATGDLVPDVASEVAGDALLAQPSKHKVKFAPERSAEVPVRKQPSAKRKR
jgi:transcriptional regulator with XRE-family HTH domain